MTSVDVLIDNGIVERLHVCTALTRKNTSSPGPTPVPSGRDRVHDPRLVQLVGIDPLEYLRDVLSRMTRKVRLIDLSDLLSHRWKQRRDVVAAFCAALARLGRGD